MNVCLVIHKYGVGVDDPCCYPLNFGYVSAVLKRNGHTVKILNYNLWDYDFAYEVEGRDVVMFGGFEEFLPHIIRDAAVCKSMGIKTVLGGALATFKPIEMAQHVDTVVVGECENIIEDALRSRGIIQGPKPNLNAIPFPDYEGIGVEEYHRRHAVRYMGVMTSRGCPYSCKFCAHTCVYQVRGLGSVFEEIDHYRAKYGVEVIVFNDNTLNVTKSRFMAVCQGMKERGIGWTAAVRVDVFDEEMAKAAKESGCEYFVVGVESFLQQKLDNMNKRVKSEQITTALDLLHKHHIGYHGNILMGFPGESYEDITQEIETMPKGYNVYPMMVQPFIGTSQGRRTLSEVEGAMLNEAFRAYAINGGMNCYPTA